MVSEAAAYFGLQLESDLVLEDEFWLWPENLDVFNLWMSVQTQWHTDNGSATGLNYPGVQVCINNRVTRKKDRPEQFFVLQQMERAALNEWAKDR